MNLNNIIIFIIIDQAGNGKILVVVFMLIYRSPHLCMQCFYLLYNYYADALAMRINVGLYITLGEYERMRDMMASTLVSWTEDMSMYPFVLS